MMVMGDETVQTTPLLDYDMEVGNKSLLRCPQQ